MPQVDLLLYGYNRIWADTGDVSVEYKPITLGNVAEVVEDLTPQFRTATLAANDTSVTLSDIPSSGDYLVEFFTSVPGLDYTAISVSGTSVTLTYPAQLTNTTVYAMITKVTS